MICYDKQFLFIITIPLWILYRVLNYVLKARKKEEFQLKHELLINGFFLYSLAVISVTFFPLFIGNDGSMQQSAGINYIPVVNTLADLKRIQSSDIPNFMLKFWIRNIGGNLVLLLPMGVFLPILRDRFNSLKTMTIAGFLISLAIETLQMLSVFIGNRGRVFDIDDLILNTIGVMIGYGCLCLFRKLWLRQRIDRRTEPPKSSRA